MSGEELFAAIEAREFQYEFALPSDNHDCSSSGGASFIQTDKKLLAKLKIFSRVLEKILKGSDGHKMSGDTTAIDCVREKSTQLAGASISGPNSPDEVVIWFGGTSCNSSNGAIRTIIKGVFDGRKNLHLERIIDSVE